MGVTMDYLQQVSQILEAFNAGKLSRRTFLRLITLVLANSTSQIALGTSLEGPHSLMTLQPNDGTQLDYQLSVVRPDDLLLLNFDFFNAGPNDDRDRIVRLSDAEQAFMVVHFPPQHIVEEVGLLEESADLILVNRQWDLNAPWASLNGGEDPRLWPALQFLPVMRAALSGPSRIAFLLPGEGIALSLSALLDWIGLNESVSSRINSTICETTITLDPPTEYQTSLEMPTFITLVPDPGTAAVPTVWHAQRSLEPQNGWSPLWHVRRTIQRPDGSFDESRGTRLFFAGSPFMDQDVPRTLAFETALTPGHIVNDPNISQLNGSAFGYLESENLMLSALGGWLKLRDVSEGQTGEKWIHKMTMGRDQYVRIAQEGFLFPFGHRAALITESARQFVFREHGSDPNSPGELRASSDAFLLQRMYIVVRESERNYESLSNEFPNAFLNGGRELPFKRVRILTETTPLLYRGNIISDPSTGSLHNIFMPLTGTFNDHRPIEFHLEGIDHDNAPITFQTPLVFVSNVDDATVPVASASFGHTAGYTDIREQKVAFTPIDTDNPSKNSVLVTSRLSFDGRLVEGGIQPPFPLPLPVESGIQPPFLPYIVEAAVRIPEIGQITGKGENLFTRIKYASKYLNASDWSDNPEEVFAEFIDQAERFNIPAEKLGIAVPTIELNGLSRLLGPIPIPIPNLDIPDPRKVLEGNLFGGIRLEQIVPGLQQALGSFNPEGYTKLIREQLCTTIENAPEQLLASLLTGPDLSIPGLIVELVHSSEPGPDLGLPEGTVELLPCGLPVAVRITFVYKSVVSELNPVLVGRRDPESQNNKLPPKLALVVTLTIPFGGTDPDYLASGRLIDFGVQIPSILTLEFEFLSFKRVKGQGFDVEPKLSGIRFQDALAFFRDLPNVLEQTGDSGFPRLQIETTNNGIFAELSATLPPIPLGPLLLRNVKITVRLTIPFTSERISFSYRVGARNDPFTLTLGYLGGGGFFAMEIDFVGTIKVLEAAIEFGAYILFEQGVARGMIYGATGFYFGLGREGEAQIQTFEGYQRVGGVLNILGLIEVSVEFYIGLGYVSRDGGVIYGVGRVTLEISVLAFSKTVTLEYKVEYAVEGGQLDRGGKIGLQKLMTDAQERFYPTFGDVVTFNDWSTYCDAFAVDEET